jgi:hypothetical protein
VRRICTRRSVALTGVEKVFGREHPYLAYPLSGLGMVHLQAGRADLARPQFERTLALDLSSVPDDDLLGATRFGLARALRASGEDEARARELATAARENYARLAETDDVRAIDAFLAATPTSSAPSPAPGSDRRAPDTP